MPRLQSKRLAAPDDVRTFPTGTAAVVNIGESVVGRAVYEPGWRWSTHMQSIAGTTRCQLHHLGYSISGLMHVVTDDGQAMDIAPDSVYEIPPGHDAWVIGDEPWTTIEWTSARTFGVAAEGPGESILLTMLFTDFVDSTSTLQRVGDTAWRDLLLNHNRLLRDELNTFRGREVATTGDGFLAVFDGAKRAVRCGIAMVRRPARSAFPSVSASIPARSNSSATKRGGWRSMPRPASCHWPDRTRSSSPRRRATSSRAQASSSKMPGRTN
jgi:hypothetical protein